ncbi:MAG: hypothetical protein ABSB19_12225 [Methylomonas sp.]|jgi:hypothetical protein
MIVKLAYGMLLAFISVNLLSIAFVGAYAWDDGAITLAYAQSLAESGRFALTGVSEVVEGTSTILLVLILAAADKIFHFNFYQFIFFSQLLALFFALLVLILVYRALRDKIQDRAQCLLISVLMSFLPMVMTEIQNGMEMTLFAALLMFFVMAYERRSHWIYVAITLLLLVRFESIFYLPASLGALYFVTRESKLLKYVGFTVFMFLVFSAVRYVYFDELLPNTIIAKMQEPYTPKGLYDKLIFKWKGLLEFAAVYSGFLLALGFLLAVNKSSYRALLLPNIKFWLFASFLIFAVISGKNWGYDGRMVLGCLPVLILLLADLTPAQDIITVRKWDGAVLFSAQKNQLAFFLPLAAIALCFLSNAPLLASDIKKIIKGGFYHGYLPEIGNAMAANYLEKNNLINNYGISPENYRITGLTADELRKLLGLPQIRLMTPDVGGVGLCCAKIDVIDIALLTNRFLAKNGYAAFDTLLESQPPDIIEMHKPWPTITNIYASAFFNRNYMPVVFNNNLLWLRKTHFTSLRGAPNLSITELHEAGELRNVRSAQYSSDTDFIFNGYPGKLYRIDTL